MSCRLRVEREGERQLAVGRDVRPQLGDLLLGAADGVGAGVRPIQNQKQRRLQEARSRLLSGRTSAEAVAYEVGYASPSQFSREYAWLFGQPPRRDAERMRDDAAGGAPAA